MIGFGDVFIPALLASLALRIDFIRAFSAVKTQQVQTPSAQYKDQTTKLSDLRERTAVKFQQE